MGYIITPQQKEKIYSDLDVDGEGRVVFLEFVKIAKEMFAFRLDDARLEASLVYALTQKDSLDLPSFPRKVLCVCVCVCVCVESNRSIKIGCHYLYSSGNQL